jgi:outer membrane receptor protein involved in Fe transport
MEVEDSNPLYGSFTFGKGYSVCPATLEEFPRNLPHWHQRRRRHLLGRLPLRSAQRLLAVHYWITHLHQNMQSVYAQDDWKLSPKLTLNLGVRWEYGSPYSERNNNLSNFNPATGTMLTLDPRIHHLCRNLRRNNSVYLRVHRQRRLRQDPGPSGPGRLCSAPGLCLCGHLPASRFAAASA